MIYAYKFLIFYLARKFTYYIFIQDFSLHIWTYPWVEIFHSQLSCQMTEPNCPKGPPLLEEIGEVVEDNVQIDRKSFT